MELITPCQDVQNASVLLRVYGMQCRCEHSVVLGHCSSGCQEGLGLGVSQGSPGVLRQLTQLPFPKQWS